MLEWKKDGYKALIALFPALLIIGVFVIYPLINTFVMSFKLDYIFYDGSYAGFGLANYIDVLSDNLFWVAVKNTFLMVIVSVPISVGIALAVSVVLNSIKKLQGLFQTIYFMPYVTNVIAIGMVFAFMFHRDYGLVNLILDKLGFDIVNWKGSGATYWSSFTVLTAYTVWSALAFKIMVFLSGLQSIDKQYYQAAQVDGTPKLRVFWRITVPLLSPMIAYITIVSFIGAFKAYAAIIAVFDGYAGPPGNERMLVTIVWYIYEFLEYPAGILQNGVLVGGIAVAAAGSFILFVFILLFTIVQLQVSKKRVHY